MVANCTEITGRANVDLNTTRSVSTQPHPLCATFAPPRDSRKDSQQCQSPGATKEYGSPRQVIDDTDKGRSLPKGNASRKGAMPELLGLMQNVARYHKKLTRAVRTDNWEEWT